jgi:hypothetical protein
MQKLDKWHFYAIGFTLLVALVFGTEGSKAGTALWHLLQTYQSQSQSIALQTEWQQRYATQVRGQQDLNLSVQFLNPLDKAKLLQLIQTENEVANVQNVQMRMGKLTHNKTGQPILTLQWKANTGYHEIGNWLNGIALLPYAITIKSAALSHNPSTVYPLDATIALEIPLSPTQE